MKHAFRTISFASLTVALLTSALIPMAANHAMAQDTPPDAAAKAPKKTPSALPPSTLPFTVNYRPWRGLILIDAISSGNTPAQFVLATGLNVNAVSPDDAPRLQMSMQETKVRVAALDASLEAKQGQLKSIVFGLHKEENISAALVDVTEMLTHVPHPDAPAGWLGAPFLSSFFVTFDFRNHAVIFDKPGSPFPKEIGVTVPIKVREGKIYAKVTLAGGKPFEALVDTGSIGTFIPTEAATRLKLKSEDRSPIVRPDGKTATIARTVVAKFSLGKLELRGIHVAYYTADSPPGADPNFAVIGLDVLRRYRVSISYQKQQMFFAPLNVAGPTEDPLNP